MANILDAFLTADTVSKPTKSTQTRGKGKRAQSKGTRPQAKAARTRRSQDQRLMHGLKSLVDEHQDLINDGLQGMADALGQDADDPSTDGAGGEDQGFLQGVASIVGAVKSVKDFTQSVILSHEGLGGQATMLSMGRHGLAAWDQVLSSVSGGSHADFLSGVMHIEKSIAQSKLGIGGHGVMKALGRMGIRDPKYTATTLKGQMTLSRQLSRLAKTRGVKAAASLGSQLGLSDQLMGLYLKGPEFMQAQYAKVMDAGMTQRDESGVGGDAANPQMSAFLSLMDKAAGDMNDLIELNEAAHNLVSLFGVLGKNVSETVGSISVLGNALRDVGGVAGKAVNILMGGSAAEGAAAGVAGRVAQGAATEGVVAEGTLGAAMGRLGLLGALGAGNLYLWQHPEVGAKVGEYLFDATHPELNPTPVVPAETQLGHVAVGKDKDAKIRQAYATFMQAGFSKDQSTGIIANLLAESQLDEHAVGDKGSAHGIAQWHPDREVAFKRQFGHDLKTATYDEQLKFVVYELTQGMYKNVGDRLKQTQGSIASNDLVTGRYESPDPKNRARDTLIRRGVTHDLDMGHYVGADKGKAALVSPTSTSTTTHETHIQNVTIQAPNGNGREIAHGFTREMQNQGVMIAGEHWVN